MTIDFDRLLNGTVSELTKDVYMNAWGKYLEFSGSEDAAMLPSTFAKFREHLIENTNYSVAYVNTLIMGVRCTLSHLHKRGDIGEDILQSFHRIRKVRRNALPGRERVNPSTRIEPEEMRHMVNCAMLDADNPRDVFNRALLLVLATSGVRVSEACAIKVEDVRMRNGMHLISITKGKGGRSRDVPISPEAYEAIQDWIHMRPVQSEYVFNGFHITNDGDILWSDKPASRQYLYKQVRMVAERAGIKNIKTHDFRRFVGTQVARTDLRAAQKVLGHSSIQMTARYYILDNTPLGITNDLFALAPLGVLLHMTPYFSANNLAYENLANLIHLGYAILRQIVLGI